MEWMGKRARDMNFCRDLRAIVQTLLYQRTLEKQLDRKPGRRQSPQLLMTLCHVVGVECGCLCPPTTTEVLGAVPSSGTLRRNLAPTNTAGTL